MKNKSDDYKSLNILLAANIITKESSILFQMRYRPQLQEQ